MNLDWAISQCFRCGAKLPDIDIEKYRGNIGNKVDK